jgi:hypothetical protein
MERQRDAETAVPDQHESMKDAYWLGSGLSAGSNASLPVWSQPHMTIIEDHLDWFESSDFENSVFALPARTGSLVLWPIAAYRFV